MLHRTPDPASPSAFCPRDFSLPCTLLSPGHWVFAFQQVRSTSEEAAYLHATSLTIFQAEGCRKHSVTGITVWLIPDANWRTSAKVAVRHWECAPIHQCQLTIIRSASPGLALCTTSSSQHPPDLPALRRAQFSVTSITVTTCKLAEAPSSAASNSDISKCALWTEGQKASRSGITVSSTGSTRTAFNAPLVTPPFSTYCVCFGMESILWECIKYRACYLCWFNSL